MCLNMTPTCFSIRDDQHRELRELRDKTGAPIAESIRRAIDAYLVEQRASLRGGRKLPKRK